MHNFRSDMLFYCIFIEVVTVISSYPNLVAKCFIIYIRGVRADSFRLAVKSLFFMKITLTAGKSLSELYCYGSLKTGSEKEALLYIKNEIIQRPNI